MHPDAFERVINPKCSYELHIGTDEYEETHEYYVMAGVEIEADALASMPEVSFAKVLPPQTYAVFTLKGEAMTSNWGDAIYQHWMPESGHKETASITIEVYDGDRFKSFDDPDSELDVWVPLRKVLA